MLSVGIYVSVPQIIKYTSRRTTTVLISKSHLSDSPEPKSDGDLRSLKPRDRIIHDAMIDCSHRKQVLIFFIPLESPTPRTLN